MTETITINGVSISKTEIDDIECITFAVAKLSVGHSESLILSLFYQCGVVSVYNQGRFTCIPTRTTETTPMAFLKKALEDSWKPTKGTTKFHALDYRTKERLIVELFKHATAQAGYFNADKRTFFKVNTNTDTRFNPAFSLSVKETDDSYKLFVNPSIVSMACCTELPERLKLNDKLIRLCSKKQNCEVYKTNNKCKYAYPGFVGFFNEITGDRNALSAIFSGCPHIKDLDYNIIRAKRTKSAKPTKIYPSFILNRDLTKNEQAGMGIDTELMKRRLPPSSIRYLHTKTIIQSIFKGDKLAVNDLNLRASIDLIIPTGLEKGDDSSSAILIEEPMLQFDPFKGDANSIEPSYVFFKGPHDGSSSARPFSKMKPVLILPKSQEKNANNLLNWLANGKEEIGYKGKTQRFVGLNHRWSKFNCRFVMPGQSDFNYADSEQDFIDAARAIANNWDNDSEKIVLVVLREVFFGDDGLDSGYSDYEKPYSLYYQLKRIFIENGIPCQMIEAGTFTRIDRFILQNLLVNLYSKMGGKPWTLSSPFSDVDAFIGIGFGVNPKESENPIYIGVANIFDSHGEWLDILSDHKLISDQEREAFGYDAFPRGVASYKLSEEMAAKIIESSLKRFKDMNPQVGYPRNIVIHKNGQLHGSEIIGILNKLRELEKSGAAFEKIGLLSIIQNHNYKLFGESHEKPYADRVPTRGAVFFLDDDEALLSTTGKFLGDRPTGKTLIYSGLGTPRPLLLKNHVVGLSEHGLPELELYSFKELIKQVFALSKIHWGSLRTDIHLPVTSLYSNRVASIISKSGIVNIPKPAAKKPWFL